MAESLSRVSLEVLHSLNTTHHASPLFVYLVPFSGIHMQPDHKRSYNVKISRPHLCTRKRLEQTVLCLYIEQVDVAALTKMLQQTEIVNIPILPEAFLNFASKSSIGPSYYSMHTPCYEVRRLFLHPELLKSEHGEGEGDPETCTNLKRAPPYGRGLINSEQLTHLCRKRCLLISHIVNFPGGS